MQYSISFPIETTEIKERSKTIFINITTLNDLVVQKVSIGYVTYICANKKAYFITFLSISTTLELFRKQEDPGVDVKSDMLYNQRLSKSIEYT